MTLAKSIRITALAAAVLALGAAVSADRSLGADARVGLTKSAAQDPISGPVLGYVFDANAASLRPLLGIPGASHVGGALALPFTLSVAAVSPTQSFALGTAVGTGALVLVDLRGPAPQGSFVAKALGGADRIVFSPRGEFAGAYDRESKTVQVLTGFGDEAHVVATVRLDALPGVLTAFAVSDDGETVLAAASTRAGGQVFALGHDSAARSVASIGRALDVVFFPGSNDALIADVDRREAIKLSDVSGSATVTVLASRQDGLEAPVAVAATDDGQALVADKSRAALIPAGGGAARFVDCDCRARTLTRLAGDSMFRLTDDLTAPISVLDAGRLATTAGDPRVMFVPALAE